MKKNIQSTTFFLFVISNVIAQTFSTNKITDWDSLWESGFYESENADNVPEEGWFWGLNMNHSSNNSVDYKFNGQLAIKNDASTPTMYFRSTFKNGKGTWAKVLHDKGDQKVNGDFTIDGNLKGYQRGGAIRVKSSYGYLDMGAQDSTSAHINTDMSNFLFNRDIYTTSNGFSSYSSDLVLKTKGIERLRVSNTNGSVLIGSLPSSTSKLHVHDGGSGGKPHEYSQLTVENNSNGMISILTPRDTNAYYGFADDEDEFVGGMQYSHTNDELIFRSNNHNDMVIKASGNVGIGTTSPKNKLSVNGTIWAQNVKIRLTDAADWVFNDTYNLRSLSEVKSYIIEHKHLPEIPSADEFRANDMEVSNMTNKFLQKIEELTLYTIEQDEQLKKQDAKLQKMEVLEARLNKLEALLTK